MGRNKGLDYGDVLHPQIPRLLIHAAHSEKAQAAHVKEEEDEGLEVEVAHAIIRPGTVVIHLVDASITLPAMMHSKHL